MNLKTLPRPLPARREPTGVIILGITLWSFRKQMNAQVYLAYTERYENLMRDCDHDFRSSLLKLTLDEVGGFPISVTLRSPFPALRVEVATPVA